MYLYHIIHYAEEILEKHKKSRIKDLEHLKGIPCIIEDIEPLILESFEDEEKTESLFFELGKRHSLKKIPLINTLSVLLSLKNGIYHLIIEREHFKFLTPIVDEYFDIAINSLSKGYLFTTIENYIKEYNIFDLWKLKNYKKAHILWLLNLSYYILGKKKKLPELDSDRCKLAKILREDEFRMKFPDEKIYQQILYLHEAIHRYAKDLVFFLRNKRYLEVFSLYKTIIAESFRFLTDIDNIFSLYELKAEDLFFNWILKVTEKSSNYLTVINVRKLGFINKFYGKETGSKIVESIYSNLKESLKNSQDFCIKGYSGDFYIFHKNELKNPEEYGRLLKENIEKLDIGVKFSTAIAILEIKDIKDPKQLGKIVTYAIEKAKKSPSGIIFMDKNQIIKEYNQKIYRLHEILNLVEEAFKNKDRIDSFFQPIFDLKEDKIFAVESLARIRSSNEYISAAAFINILYETNLITELDKQIFKKVTEYREKLKGITDIVFVNISPLSLSHYDQIKEILPYVEDFSKTGIKVIIELTEQAVLENIEVVKLLNEKYGLVFAVDDFGTGYSSIKTVYELSSAGIIEFLKIDGSLVKNINSSPESLKPVKTILSFAKTLNLKTIAEFVENENIAKILKEIGVDYGQGYYFQKPVPVFKLKKEGEW